jgi:diamine N-acetyltransferase
MLAIDRTILRMPIDEDKQTLLTMRNDLDIQSLLMSRAKPNSINKVDKWLDIKLSDDRGVFFIIADKDTNLCVGFVQLINMDFINQRGDLGIWISEEQQGRGYAKDALFLLEGYVRRIFNIRKIVLQVLINNHRAINFYLKSGYDKVGIMKEHFYANDCFHDVLLMEKRSIA